MSRDIIEVRVQQDSAPGFWVMFWLLAIIMVIWHFIGWILLGIGIIAAAVFGYWLYRKFQEANAVQKRLIAEVSERADRQLKGYMSGDPRATYGWGDE